MDKKDQGKLLPQPHIAFRENLSVTEVVSRA